MSKPADDDIRAWFESKYVGAWDLRGQDVTVTIAKVVGGVVEGEGGRKDKAPLLYFVGKSKPMILNKTNLKTVASIVGSFKAKDWVGRRITIYGTMCKGKAGGQVDCVRVRPIAPKDKNDTAIDFDAPVDVDMRARQMAEAGELPGGTPPREPGSDDV